MKKHILIIILLFTSVFINITAKSKDLDLLANGRKLTYKISYNGEEYEYIIRVKRDGKKNITFDYNISGGSSILSGFVSYKANFKYTSNDGMAIPGFTGTGTFEPYILMDFNKYTSIFKASYDDTIAVQLNKENYKVTKGGEDGFTPNTEEDTYFRALYCSLIKDGNTAELVLGTGINKGIILFINIGDNFNMRLSKIE